MDLRAFFIGDKERALKKSTNPIEKLETCDQCYMAAD